MQFGFVLEKQILRQKILGIKLLLLIHLYFESFIDI